MSKPYYSGYDISEAENLLRNNGLTIDKYDGVVSVIDGNTTDHITRAMTITFRDVIVSITPHQDQIHFKYSTSKKSYFPSQKHRQIMPCEEWFDLIERVAHIIARKTYKPYVSIYVGRMDIQLIKQKGYRKDRTFYKKHI